MANDYKLETKDYKLDTAGDLKLETSWYVPRLVQQGLRWPGPTTPPPGPQH